MYACNAMLGFTSRNISVGENDFFFFYTRVPPNITSLFLSSYLALMLREKKKVSFLFIGAPGVWQEEVFSLSSVMLPAEMKTRSNKRTRAGNM